MRKGLETIEHEMYLALQSFFASGVIGGMFYESGTRPQDAVAEDAVLAVSAADAEQIQAGRARINIYVPDIDCGIGYLVPDKGRIAELQSLDERIVSILNSSFNGEYLFDLFAASSSMADKDGKQHFATIHIKFKRITF